MSAKNTKRFSLHTRIWILVAALTLLAGCAPSQPVARVDNVTETLHGTEITDPYRWLEDQDAPETRAWIEAQHTYTQYQLSRVSGRDKIKKRFTELLKIDSMGAPTVRNGRYFFSKRAADQELTVYYYRDGIDGEDKVLLDPHGMSDDNRTSVRLREVSDDGKLIAYGIRQGGEDENEIRWRYVDTGEELPDVHPRNRYGGINLTPDQQGFYYSLNDGKEVHHVYYHAMGTNPADDEEIWGDGFKPGDGVGVGLSENGRWLMLSASHGWSHTELHVKDLSIDDGPVRSITGGLEANFSGSFGGDTFFLRTNWNAPKYRILRVDPANPARRNWREIIPEKKDAVLSGFSATGGRLFLNYMRNVNSEIKIHDAQGRAIGEIELPTMGAAFGPGGRWDATEAFYSFTSFHYPTTSFRYNTETGEQTVWAKRDVPVDTDAIEVKQVWYESKDGTKIPMFLVHKKGIEPNGAMPTYLTGYGGFNLSRRPSFSSTAVAWVELGGLFALPNLRGGGEFGEEWHKAGMHGNKQNVFDDFHAAAEWLIENNYTNPSKIAISGGSNGGLLVGAAFTQRPDLFQAVICSVPLLDMVRYHQFLVARFWIPEYGSSEDPEQFKYIYDYSPYHNVKAGTDYPAILFVSGDSDTRVAPLHARKMAALMQASTGGTRPILLHYDTKAGHSGGTPTSKQIEVATDRFAFLVSQLGVPVN